MLERGYFAGFSIYPQTKMGNERMTEIVRQYGAERIIVNSACDWGVSDPLGGSEDRRADGREAASPPTSFTTSRTRMRSRSTGSREHAGSHWLDPAPVDQRTLFEGNSVLRGGQTPRIDTPRGMAGDLRIEAEGPAASSRAAAHIAVHQVQASFAAANAMTQPMMPMKIVIARSICVFASRIAPPSLVGRLPIIRRTNRIKRDERREEGDDLQEHGRGHSTAGRAMRA